MSCVYGGGSFGEKVNHDNDTPKKNAIASETTCPPG